MIQLRQSIHRAYRNSLGRQQVCTWPGQASQHASIGHGLNHGEHLGFQTKSFKKNERIH